MDSELVVGANSLSRFRELHRSLRRGGWAVLVGAGASVGAGLPDWESLARSAAARFAVPVDEYLAAENYPVVLQDCLQAEPETGLFREFVGELLCEDVAPTEVHHLLMRLPFEVFATINLDCLLLKAQIQAAPPGPPPANPSWVAFPNLRSVELSGRRIAFLHGRCNCEGDPLGPLGSQVVLTTAEYTSAYAANSLLPHALAHLFTSFRVLFVGTSLEDHSIRRILRWAQEVRENVGRMGTPLPGPHYAVVPTKATETVAGAADYRYAGREAGVLPIYYLHEEGDAHIGLLELMRYLARVASAVGIGPPRDSVDEHE